MKLYRVNDEDARHTRDIETCPDHHSHMARRGAADGLGRTREMRERWAMCVVNGEIPAVIDPPSGGQHYTITCSAHYIPDYILRDI